MKDKQVCTVWSLVMVRRLYRWTRSGRGIVPRCACDTAYLWGSSVLPGYRAWMADYGGLGWVVVALDLGLLLGGGGVWKVGKAVLCPLCLLLLGEHVGCCPVDGVCCAVTAIIVQGWSREHFIEGSCAYACLELHGDRLRLYVRGVGRLWC